MQMFNNIARYVEVTIDQHSLSFIIIVHLIYIAISCYLAYALTDMYGSILKRKPKGDNIDETSIAAYKRSKKHSAILIAPVLFIITSSITMNGVMANHERENALQNKIVQIVQADTGESEIEFIRKMKSDETTQYQMLINDDVYIVEQIRDDIISYTKIDTQLKP